MTDYTSDSQPTESNETPSETATIGNDSVEEDLLKKSQLECEKFKQVAFRAQADLVNLRNRLSTEKQANEVRITRCIGESILSIADQLEAALGEATPDEVVSLWLEGIQAVYNNLLTVLQGMGFERFDATDSVFDPNLHEALLFLPSKEHAPGNVVKQFRAGYKHQNEVIRHAQVQVAATAEDVVGTTSPMDANESEAAQPATTHEPENTDQDIRGDYP